jgi:hypothetical protein
MGVNLTKLSTANDVKAGLEELGAAYKQYAEGVMDNGIDGETLYAITEAELIELGVASSLHKRRMLREVAAFVAAVDKPTAGPSFAPSQEQMNLKDTEMAAMQQQLQQIKLELQKAKEAEHQAKQQQEQQHPPMPGQVISFGIRQSLVLAPSCAYAPSFGCTPFLFFFCFVYSQSHFYTSSFNAVV